GRSAAAAGMVFIGLVLVLQWLRRDLWWVDAQLSAYLHGPYGLLLRTAYCLLAASMAWLALGLYAALAPAASPPPLAWSSSGWCWCCNGCAAISGGWMRN
ncbi:DUF998 domain-containing protein, partial [Xanthomonas perforans]